MPRGVAVAARWRVGQVPAPAAVEWALSGLVHTALVTMDGGFGECPTLDLSDSHGRLLGEALHEEWPAFDPREQG